MPTQRTGKGRGPGGGRRPVSFVRHPDTDESVDGLRHHKPTSRYYRIQNGRRIYYKPKGLKGIAYLRRAIFEHECWQGGNEPTESVAVTVYHPARDDFGTELSPVATFDQTGRPINVHYISQEDLAAYFREQLGDPEKRVKFAHMVGYLELLNLHALKSPEEPLPLQALIDNYTQNKQFKHKRQYSNIVASWKLFTEAVAVPTLNDVDVAQVQAFNKALRASGVLRTQRNHRNHVQSILSYAAAAYKPHREKIQSVREDILSLCKLPKSKTERQPKPMKPSEFSALLDECKTNGGSKKWYAFLLVGLNFAMHGSEAAGIRLAEIDFEDGLFTSKRTKTGVPRVAVLWSRTKTAIQQYMASDEYLRHPTLLFTADDRKPLSINVVTKKIKELRDKAGLSDNVVFDGIRDLTRTKAGAENRVAIAWLMGHTLGDDDKYAYRDPLETAKVLAKVEKAIFSK